MNHNDRNDDPRTTPEAHDDQPPLDEMLDAVNHNPMPQERRQAFKRRLMEQINRSPDLFIVRREEGEWHDFAPGIEIKLLHRDADTGAETTLWRVQPGTEVDAHSHEMDEECLVLEGDLEIGGELLVAGDYLLGKRGFDHPVVMSPSGALLLLRSQPYLAG
ncbi:MAG: cupin domain-containing protein [Pseudomonadota bacterium]